MSSDRSVSLHLSRPALWLVASLLIAPWLAFAWIWLGPRGSATATLRPNVAATANHVGQSADLEHAHAGPWGDLEFFRILVEPPEEFILTDYTRPELRPWVFKGYTDAALDALWTAARLDAAQKKYVSDPAHREIRADAILLRPDRTFIIGLTTEARAKIYGALGEFPENFSQYNPFRLRSTAADGWLDGTDTPDAAIALTKRLFYRRGTATCFSDEAVVLSEIPTAPQRARFIKALSRKSGLVVQLQVQAGEDVDPLVAYWGRGGRSKDLKPLLQSLARRPNGGAIDIVHLIPRFARLLLYTYPLPSDRPIDANHDCHWTSFNFQNDQPDERFSDINYVRQVLLEQYYPVPGAPTLGDIIMFVRGDGVVVHSCVYVADDIVFSKNGPAYSVPWLLMPLADVQAFYAANPDIQMRRYRAKNL
jgi:hypothetical protein